MPWIVIALLLIAVPFAVGLARINELFVLRVEAGRLRVVRGRIPRGLLQDIDDVVKGAAVERARVRAVVEGGEPVIRVDGDDLPPGLGQRLRNTMALWPLAKIRNAPKR